MTNKLPLLILLPLVLPLFSFAQKAYEAVPYRDTLHNTAIQFTLANGYFGACELTVTNIKTKKTSTFLPEKNVADDKKMKFIHHTSSGKILKDYFVLEGMEEYYDSPPEKIYGKYYCKGNVYSVSLKQHK